ncbi:MAG: FAD binding domain-containing protein, partial [Anaerolineales bacterium]|nr:FAD binding domain-containing protein [Anaerolineales bacterium]
GATTNIRSLAASEPIRRRCTALVEACESFSTTPIMIMGTLGGNLCNASPSADLAPPLIARSASARIVSASGEREISLEDFFYGPGESALQAGELLQAINIPPPQGSAVYIKHTPRAFMDIAVVGVAARLELAAGHCRAAGIVLGAVAPTPLRARQAEAALVGQSLTDEIIENAARIASEKCAPIDDIRGSAWYRRRMVGVLTRRALTALSRSQPVHAR